MDVVTPFDSATATTTATGNGLSGATEIGSLDVETTQRLGIPTGNLSVVGGNISSVTHGNYTPSLTSIVGNATAMTTASTGNELEADNLGGTALTGNVSQSTGVVTVTSETDFNGANVVIGSVSAASQAIINSIGFGLSGNATSNTTSNVTTTQTSAATVDAETGSRSNGGAQLDGSAGTVAFTTVGMANNVSATGVGTTSQTINATQTQSGNLTQAAGFVTIGTAQTVQGVAAATANNISATNEGGSLAVTDNQNNSSFVYSQSVVSANIVRRPGEATADGVGNSAHGRQRRTPRPPSIIPRPTPAEFGPSPASTGTGGSPGYDASTSATAMGNSATGYACSACGGTINVSNSQTNSGGVDATATATMDGPSRTVNTVATAVGNNATFYVSRPGG